ncbi:MAG TPA: hypothetical protein VM536_10955 [Chloroflexia bacterium]|nr:hypothetical protein [Chloroflexia bacterium]
MTNRDQAQGGEIDPSAAPGVDDAGSTGHSFGAGMAGAGTGTSVGPSRGNTGPGTGSDALEARYGEEPQTRFSEMVGVGPERPDGDQGGNSPLRGSERHAAAAQFADPDVKPLIRSADTGTADAPSSSAGLGDNDIAVETEQR